MRARVVIGVLLLLGAGVCLFPAQAIWDDGCVHVSVMVTSSSGAPITSVTCEVFGNHGAAQYSLDHLAPPEGPRGSAVADPFRGEALDVEVWTTRRIHRALLWEHTHYNQARSLLVIVQYRDGRREGRSVEVPDVRQAKSLQVEMP